MTNEQDWTFECDAPLDAFLDELRANLSRRGFRIAEARIYHFAADLGGARLFFHARFAKNGILVTVKAKAGLLDDPRPALAEAFAACRETQVRLAKPPM